MAKSSSVLKEVFELEETVLNRITYVVKWPRQNSRRSLVSMLSVTYS